VAGQQDGTAALPFLLDAGAEGCLHQRVEPCGGLVEQQQFDVGGERGGADGGARPDVDAVRSFIDRLASELSQAGFPRMPARVFAALLASESGRMTAAGLADLLRVSPAAVSGSVRYLSQVGLVSRQNEPGSRRVAYLVPDDVWDQIMRLRDQLMSRWVATMREGVEVLGADSAAGRRLTESIRYFEFIGAEVHRLAERWRDLQARRRDA